jgi:hypothetical protein
MYNVRKVSVGICEYKPFERDRETESCMSVLVGNLKFIKERAMLWNLDSQTNRSAGKQCCEPNAFGDPTIVRGAKRKQPAFEAARLFNYRNSRTMLCLDKDQLLLRDFETLPISLVSTFSRKSPAYTRSLDLGSGHLSDNRCHYKKHRRPVGLFQERLQGADWSTLTPQSSWAEMWIFFWEMKNCHWRK